VACGYVGGMVRIGLDLDFSGRIVVDSALVLALVVCGR